MANADPEDQWDQWDDIDDEITDEDHTRRSLHHNSVRKPTIECDQQQQQPLARSPSPLYKMCGARTRIGSGSARRKLAQ